MHFSRTLLSFCCIVALCCLAQTAQTTQTEQKTRQKDFIQNADSNVYKIKTLQKEHVFHKIKSVKNKVKHTQSIQPTHPIHPINPIYPIQPASTEMTITEIDKRPTKFKKLKNSHGLNKKLLSKLGFTKVKAPNSHNRKRLAIESRRHASPDDSHMFIIKLPPNAHYYSSPKANGDVTNSASSSQNSLYPTNSIDNKEKASSSSASALSSAPSPLESASTSASASASAAVAIDNGKKVSFPFNSNGRPGRIYHWNLPIIQKILEDKERFAHVPNAMKQQLIDIKDTPTWTKPWENETIEKSYGKASMMHHYKKSLKRKSPSYYAPASTVNKNSFHKYFAGNGKPKGFFVIKENQKKPLYYKNIVS